MSDCKNPNCEEKNLHPVTVRSHEGCCGPLCEEVMDHEKTLIENEKLKARVEALKAHVAELDGEISVDIEDFDAQYGIRVFAKRCEKGVWSGKLNRPSIVAIDLKQVKAEGETK